MKALLLFFLTFPVLAEEVLTTDIDEKEAARKAVLWREACDGEKHDGVACGDLGALHVMGKGVARDEAKALEYYAKACEHGQALRCFRAASFAANGKGGPVALEKAATLFGKGCRMLDPDNCLSYYALTRGVRTGLDGVSKPVEPAPKGDPEVEKWVVSVLNTGCDKGGPNYCGNLGWIHEVGDLVPQDLAKALRYYERACELGDGERCDRAGRFRANGQGAPRDAEKAAALFERFCALKHALACPSAQKVRHGIPINLTVAVPAGKVVGSTPEMRKPPPFSTGVIPNWALEPPADPVPLEGVEGAQVELVRACNQGDARACGNAAAPLVDENGKAVKQPELARRLYQKACGLGRAQRCVDLARFFAHGWGAGKSAERERAALQRACDLGHKKSCRGN